MANRQDHLIVLIISTLMFLTGVFAGIAISRSRLVAVDAQINEFYDSINSLETALLISDALNNEALSCSFLHEKLNETRNELSLLADKAVEYEDLSKIQDVTYKELKKQYNSVRAQYWLMLEKLKNQCSNNYSTVLFFYGTLNDCPACRDQGIILSHLASKDDSIYVVSLDADEDLLIVRTLKQAFNISQVPSIIIDGELIINGFISSANLSSAFQARV